jgi:hypothetical protein
MDTSHLISASVTPVVLISACGLITLALYNRLGAILSRLRAFHQQKLELLKDNGESETVESHTLLDMLDSQIAKVTLKARVIQKGLYCLLSAVVSFLLCSIFAALAVVNETFSMVALGMHFVGLLLFLTGIGWAIRELALSITPLDEENAYLQSVTANQLAKRHESQGRRYKIAKGA